MASLINVLLDRLKPAPAKPPDAGQGRARDAAASPGKAASSPLTATLCRLCGAPIQPCDTVAAGGADVVHTSCYDGVIEGGAGQRPV